MIQPKTLEEAMKAALAARGQVQKVDGPGFDRLIPAQYDNSGAASLLQAPRDPEAYQISVPTGMDRDAELEAKARQWFHRAGLPQGVASGIVDAYCRKLCGKDPADPMQAERAEAELARDWGDGYGRKIAAVQDLINRCGGAEELAEILGETGLGNDPWLIRTLAAIAEAGSAPGAAR